VHEKKKKKKPDGISHKRVVQTLIPYNSITAHWFRDNKISLKRNMKTGGTTHTVYLVVPEKKIARY